MRVEWALNRLRIFPLLNFSLLLIYNSSKILLVKNLGWRVIFTFSLRSSWEICLRKGNLLYRNFRRKGLLNNNKYNKNNNSNNRVITQVT